MSPRKPKAVDIKQKHRWVFPWLKFIYLAFLTLLLLLLPQQNAYSFREYTEEYELKKILISPSPAPYPVNITGVIPPDVSSYGVVIMDVASGVILFEKNPEDRLFPASTTKIMTALVALDSYNLTDVVTVQNVITEGQVMGLTPGETITVENLLYGTLVHSANDAAYALAVHHPRGVAGFVEDMNLKAEKLHLTGTHFVNPVGFDGENHYTTPRDLARLSQSALKNPILVKIVGVPQITVSDTSYLHFHPLKNINELLGKIPGVSGFKTGYTQLAGQSLVTTVKRQGQEILIILLKSQDRFGETEMLLNWVFANYEWENMGYKE